MDLIISSLYHAISLSTMLISQQCLFLALTVLDRAYFRDMLIFETMLIFPRVRYLEMKIGRCIPKLELMLAMM